MGYCLVGMVENKKDDCSYPKGRGVSRHSGILSLGPGGDSSVLARKGTRCAMCRNRQSSFAGEHLVQSMPTAVLSAQGEETRCLFKFFYH